MKAIASVVLLLALAHCVVSQNNYYLSPDGGSTACFKSNPCATLTDIANVLSGLSNPVPINIFVAGGTYTDPGNFDVELIVPVVMSALSSDDIPIFDGSSLDDNVDHFWVDPTDSFEMYQISVSNVKGLFYVNEMNTLQIESSGLYTIDDVVVGSDMLSANETQRLSISYSYLNGVGVHAATRSFYNFGNQVQNSVIDFHEEWRATVGGGNYTDSIVFCDGAGIVTNNIFTFTEDFHAPVVKIFIPILLNLAGDKIGWNVTKNDFYSAIPYAAVDFNSRGVLQGNTFHDPSDIFFNADNLLDGLAYGDAMWAIIDSDFTSGGDKIHVNGGYFSLHESRLDHVGIFIADSEAFLTPQIKTLFHYSSLTNCTVSIRQTKTNRVPGIDFNFYGNQFHDSSVSVVVDSALPLAHVQVAYNSFDGAINADRAMDLVGCDIVSVVNEFGMCTNGAYHITNSSFVSDQDNFHDNMADQGPAIAFESCSAVITEANFTTNTANNYGGAIYLSNTLLKIDNSNLHDNHAHYGGVFYLIDGSSVILGSESDVDGNIATSGSIATCIDDPSNKIYFGLYSLVGENTNLAPGIIASDIQGCFQVGNLFLGPRSEDYHDGLTIPCGSTGRPCNSMKSTLRSNSLFQFDQLIVSIINCHDASCIFLGDSDNFGLTYPDIPVTIRFYPAQEISFPEPIFTAINTSDPFAIVSNDLTLLGIRVVNPQGPLISTTQAINLVLSFSNVNVERLMLSETNIPTLKYLFVKRGQIKQNTQVIAAGGIYFYQTELYHDLFDLFITNDGEYIMSGTKVDGDMLMQATAGSDITMTVDHGQYYSSNFGFEGFSALYFEECNFQNSHLDMFDNIKFVEFLVCLFGDSPKDRNSVTLGDIDTVILDHARFIRSKGIALAVTGPHSHVYVYGSTFDQNTAGAIVANNTLGSLYVRRTNFDFNTGSCITAVGGNVTLVNIAARNNIGTVVDHTFDDDDGASTDYRGLTIYSALFDSNSDPYAIVRAYNIPQVFVSNVTFTNNQGEREGMDFRYFQDLTVQQSSFTHNGVTNLDIYSNQYFVHGVNPTITLTDLLFFDNVAQYTSCIDCNCNGCTFDIDVDDVTLFANGGTVVDCPGFYDN